jgi:pimeloyl-ACP methyl ester carboxylesterase
MTLVTSTAVKIADDVGKLEPALLFLPGWCANRTVLEDLVAPSGRHRRALALDWRGHGESAAAGGDFGEKELVEDALAVTEASPVRQLVPVALAHAGWIAIELRRRLGAMVPKLVLMECLILEAPLRSRKRFGA